MKRIFISALAVGIFLTGVAVAAADNGSEKLLGTSGSADDSCKLEVFGIDHPDPMTHEEFESYLHSTKIPIVNKSGGMFKETCEVNFNQSLNALSMAAFSTYDGKWQGVIPTKIVISENK